MTISFPLTWPTVPGVTSLTIGESNVVGLSAAPFSGVQQVQEHQGQWWTAEAEWRPMYREEIDPWMGFFSSLRGMTGTFILPDLARPTARGSASVTPGSPQVDGAGQSGLTLKIKTTGLGSVAGYLKANDRFSLGTGASRQLYKVVADVNLVSNGATMDIWPRLRTSPGNNDTVYVANASGRFRLTMNAIEESMSGRICRLPTLTFREAL